MDAMGLAGLSGRWAAIDHGRVACSNGPVFFATYLVIRAHIDFGRVWSAACP